MPSSADPRGAVAAMGVPDRLAGPLGAALRGDVPPNVGLMHLLIQALHPEEIDRALEVTQRALEPASVATARLGEVRRLWCANPGAWGTVRGVLAQVAHDRGPPADPGEALVRTAAEFDRAALVAPDASAALYALGSPEILAAATAEIVGRLREWGLLGRERIALDLGCGNGRVTGALAPEMEAVIGLDISREMLRAARLRCRGLRNVALAQVSGADLGCLADGAFGLVLAVDSFPYLVQAGGDLAARHVREAARVLEPAGDLVILNYSYRGDLGAQRAELAALAAASGLALLRHGERPFTLWDGVAFQLRKA